jgi:hypothetical protein
MKKILEEGLSDIVYHFTYIHSVVDILEENRFKLSTNLGSDADLTTSKNKFYFFSTTRSKTKQYRNGNVKIKLDGKKLGYKYKGFPIDYWQYSKNPKDWGDKSGYRQTLLSSEEEDRIISNKPYIDNSKSYILEIHILLSKFEFENLKKLINFSKEIPIFFYTDKKSFLIENKRNVVNINDINFTKEDSEEGYNYVEEFSLWRLASLLSYDDEEMKNKVVEVLSKKMSKQDVVNKIDETLKKDNYKYFNWFRLSKINTSHYEYITVIKNEIHNARSSKNESVVDIIQLVVQYMNKHKLKNITDFIYKKLKGNYKYQDDFRDNLINDFNSKIDIILKDNIDKYNQYRYRVGDYTYDNIFLEFPELRMFLYREIYKIKEYIKNTVLNKDIEFRYISGQIQKSYIMDYMKLNDIDYNQLLATDKYKELGENFDLSEDLIDDLKRIIENIVFDIDYDSYTIVQKYIEQYKNQFNINESKLINIIKEELDNIKKELGSGIHGNAIKKGDKVYKITNSKNEYDISKKIKDSNIEFNTLPKIYGIRILENNKYLIIRDFINNEISDDLGELIGGEIDEIIQFFMEKTINVKNSQTNLTELFDSKFLSFLEELKKELNQLGYVRSFDIFGLSNNIGIDKNNNYKLFDF